MLKAIEEEILQGQSTEARSSHSYCILQPYIVYGQTGLVALEFRAANNFAKELSEKEGILIYSDGNYNKTQH